MNWSYWLIRGIVYSANALWEDSLRNFKLFFFQHFLIIFQQRWRQQQGWPEQEKKIKNRDLSVFDGSSGEPWSLSFRVLSLMPRHNGRTDNLVGPSVHISMHDLMVWSPGKTWPKIQEILIRGDGRQVSFLSAFMVHATSHEMKSKWAKI